MALPASRDEFKEYCLRSLGKPVLKINVDDTQVEDRIDEALQYWYDWAYDGSDRTYYKHQMTQEDKDNKYITIPENIIGVVRIFDLSYVSSNVQNPFNIQFQMMMNDMYMISQFSLIPYYMAFTHLQFIQQLLIGQIPVRYNRHMNRLYIDMDWTRMQVGQWFIVEAFQVIDPETYTDVWKDRQFIDLATAMIKRQWANNMKKYKNVELLGGVTMSGQEMYDEAVQELEDAKQALRDSSFPPMDLIG